MFVALLTAVVTLIPLLTPVSPGARAATPGNEHFQRTWARTDQPVAELLANRTWMWGVEGNTPVLTEQYLESPGGERQVQYFDKSRMEINNPDADPNTTWYVTNGLLVVELMSGQMQTGNATFETREPAQVNVAGDADDPTGPTYATFAMVADAPPFPFDQPLTQRIDRQGNVTNDPALAGYGVEIDQVDPITNHAIAGPFWAFMNSEGTIYEDGQYIEDKLFENPYFATGRPVTEAYWANVKVAGTYKDVLAQCFERRCLTYTPDNPEGWQIEAGNVGQHYYTWRYLGTQPSPLAGMPVLNEILFWPLEGQEQWVEIYNPGETISIEGWHLTNGDGSSDVELPAVSLPADSYLVVHFSDGEGDLDLGDGRGDYYAGSDSFFADKEDEAALYTGEPSVDTIIDVAAWSYSDVYDGRLAHDHAVAAGIWTEDTFFDATGRAGIDLVHPVSQGETIGRDADSTDTDTPGDWGNLGGEDALGQTPGARNLHAFTPPEDNPEPPPPPPGGKAQWTVMVFADGRSNQQTLRAVLWELNKMERSGSNDDVNIVAQAAWGAGGGTAAARWRLTADNDLGQITSPRYDIGAGTPVDPGDPAAVGAFISWAKGEFPADRYAFVFIGHGQGWKGTMLAGADRDFLTMSEVQAGLSALGSKFEVVEFESCLMGQAEVGYQIEPVARMMVASEEVMWSVLPWTAFFDELKANPGWDAGQYADRKAELNAEGHAVSRSASASKFYTMASIDLAGLKATLLPAVNGMASELKSDVEDYNEHEVVADNGQIVIKHGAQEAAEDFADTNFKDLRHFAELVQGLPLRAANPAGDVVNALATGGPVVRWEDHGSRNPDANGLSVYFPHDLLLPDGTLHDEDDERARYPNAPTGTLMIDSFDDPKYDPATTDTHLYKRDAAILIPSLAGEPHAMPDDPDFSFPNNSGWDEFLHRYYKPVADACIRYNGDCLTDVIVPLGADVTLSGSGSSDSDGPEDAAPGEAGNDVPAHTTAVEHYYWDLDTTTDNPAPKPAYQEGVHYAECDGEDCDRDDVDDPDDDRDAAGKLVPYTCTVPGTHQIRLMVWDEHHDQGRARQEDRDHNDGRHWLHFNVDAAAVTIHCGLPSAPIKQADEQVVAPGSDLIYTVVVPANPELEALSDAYIVDPLPEIVEFGEVLACSSGECFYDQETHTVVMAGATIEPGGAITMELLVYVPPEIPQETPPEIVNCAQTLDGLEVGEACVTVQLEYVGTEPAG